MAELPASFYVHTALVQPFLGAGAYGDVLGPSEAVPAWIEDRRRYVKTADGVEVLSEATFRCSRVWADTITPGSIVELHGKTFRVLAVANHDDGGLGAWQHLEVSVG